MESDDQLELRAEHLTGVASDTSRHVRNVYITFLLLCTYIGVIIGSTTHEQLLRVDPITLPILNVGLPIVGFYIFIPWLLVIFHFNMLLQFYFLSRVLRRADEAIDKIKLQSSKDEIRDTLFPFHFSHLLAGRQHGKGLRFLLTIIVWITVMLVPLLLLVWAQVQFLPYHDEMITWVQRVVLMADFTILWILWPMTMSPQGSLRTWWWHFITATPKALWAIIIGLWIGMLVLLKRSTMSQLSAKWASLRSSHHARGAMALLISTLVLIPFSVFVAVLPDKTMERWLTEPEPESDLEREYEHVPESWIVDIPKGMTRKKWKHSPMLRLTYTLFEAVDAPFRRNLAIIGKVLVAGSPTDATLVALQEGKPEEQELAFQEIRGLGNLAGRDLRYANLSYSYLPKANLNEAQLQGSNLYHAQLQGAELYKAQLQGANLSMAHLQEANLNQAQFQGARLSGAQLQGAKLNYANLKRVNLGNAQLQGAELWNAQLQGAELSRAELQGAELWNAQLQGAELNKAQLQGANLKNANLKKASLSGAQLQGANLELSQLQQAKFNEAQLQGANLFWAKLQSAYLHKAQLQGTNLSGAQLQGANLSQAQFQGARLSGAQFQGANLQYANLQGADLQSAQLQGANLQSAKLQGAYLYKAQLQGAILKDAKLSLAVLLNLGRGQFTREVYWELKKKVNKEYWDQQLSKRILKDLHDLIGKADDLVFGTATHHALCDEVDPDRECLTLEQEEQFVKEWGEYIVSLACPDSYISEGVARQVIQHSADPLISRQPGIYTLLRHQASMIANRLLSPDCKGGVGLPDDVRKKLQELSRDSKP